MNGRVCIKFTLKKNLTPKTKITSKLPAPTIIHIYISVLTFLSLTKQKSKFKSAKIRKNMISEFSGNMHHLHVMAQIPSTYLLSLT